MYKFKKFGAVVAAGAFAAVLALAGCSGNGGTSAGSADAGSAAKSDCENLTAAVCDILSEDAGVPSDRSYVKFEFSDKWGYDGYMF